MMTQYPKIKVLFVCLGNICRSPMAEAVFQAVVDEAGLGEAFEIASAATSPWEVGNPPHPGTREILRKKGIALKSNKRSKMIDQADFDYYDYIVAMDESNLRDLARFGNKARRLLDYAPGNRTQDVPDPYYDHNFNLVFDLVDRGSRGLLEAIRAERML